MPNLANRLESTLHRTDATGLYGATTSNSSGVTINTVQYAFTANAAALTASAGFTDFVPTNRLTAASTLSIAGDDTARGKIYVAQDTTGDRTLVISAPGRTVLREVNALDDNPLGIASSITCYEFHLFSMLSSQYCRLIKVFL